MWFHSYDALILLHKPREIRLAGSSRGWDLSALFGKLASMKQVSTNSPTAQKAEMKRSEVEGRFNKVQIRSILFFSLTCLINSSRSTVLSPWVLWLICNIALLLQRQQLSGCSGFAPLRSGCRPKKKKKKSEKRTQTISFPQLPLSLPLMGRRIQKEEDYFITSIQLTLPPALLVTK